MRLAVLAIVLLASVRSIYAGPYEKQETLKDGETEADQYGQNSYVEADSEELKDGKIEQDHYDQNSYLEADSKESDSDLDSYIVVFKEEATTEEVTSHKKIVKASEGVGPIKYEYDFGEDFRGYAAPMSEENVKQIESDPAVKFVEKDSIMYTDQAGCSLHQPNAPWGLARSSTPFFHPFNRNYFYRYTGMGSVVYVLDTGIDVSHPTFGGRARWGFSFDRKFFDDQGHGTHVAGTIMGKDFGVAKLALAIAVRVCGNVNGRGSCPTSAIVAGLNYVRSQHRRGAKSVINMSLGGPASNAMDLALKAVIGLGVHAAVAAGNDNINPCFAISPARVPEAVTVGAIDINNRAFYNYGHCIDISAPGVNVLSAMPGRKQGTLSGTSMASPHVAGAIAVRLQSRWVPPAQMQAILKGVSTKGQMTGLNFKPGTPNSILFIPCLP